MVEGFEPFGLEITKVRMFPATVKRTLKKKMVIGTIQELLYFRTPKTGRGMNIMFFFKVLPVLPAMMFCKSNVFSVKRIILNYHCRVNKLSDLCG